MAEPISRTTWHNSITEPCGCSMEVSPSALVLGLEFAHIGDLRLMRQVSAVAGNRLARDIPRFVGGEERGQCRDVLGLAEFRRENMRLDQRHEHGVVSHGPAQNNARCDGVAAYALKTVLRGYVLRERIDRSLRWSICC